MCVQCLGWCYLKSCISQILSSFRHITGNTHTCILSHTAVTPLSELQCYFSGVHVPASIYKCIYVCIVYVPVGVVLWPFSLDVLYLCVCGVFGVLVLFECGHVI